MMGAPSSGQKKFKAKASSSSGLSKGNPSDHSWHSTGRHIFWPKWMWVCWRQHSPHVWHSQRAHPCKVLLGALLAAGTWVLIHLPWICKRFLLSAILHCAQHTGEPQSHGILWVGTYLWDQVLPAPGTTKSSSIPCHCKWVRWYWKLLWAATSGSGALRKKWGSC